MFAKVVWKSALFALSIFMLLLTMGYGQGNYGQDKNWGTFSGQAKVAKPGARVAGFRSVEAPAEPEMSFFDTVRYTTEQWLGGGEMRTAGPTRAKGSELQKLKSRTSRERQTLAVVNMN